jgi:hypothetical protein
MSRLHVWVERMMLPLGRVMVIGLLAGCLLINGTPSITKCPVVPESKIAHATLATNHLFEKIPFDIFSHK